MLRKIIVSILMLMPFLASAAQSVPLEDVEYKRIPAQPVETGKNIEVREFFWYGCSHCYALEPHLQRWLKKLPRHVTFVRTPGVFNERWAVHARAYYSFEALGITEKMHGPLFRAIHAEKQQLGDPQSIAEFVAKNGGDRKLFLDTYQSFGVQANLNQAIQLARGVGLESVPTLVVDGKFVTNANIAGGYDRVPRVLDYMIKQAAAERRSKKK